MLTILLLSIAVLLSSPADGRQTHDDATCIDASRICRNIDKIIASFPANDSLEIPRECVRLGIAKRQANFAIDLLRSINSAKPSVSAVVSPFSVALTFAALMAGASGNTLRELQTIMGGRRAGPTSIRDHFPTLLRDIRAQNKGFKAAQFLYLANNANIKPEFLDFVSGNYAAHVRNVDFRQPGAAAEIMNQNVSDATEGRIAKAIDPQDISSTARLMLINAILFKAPWVYPFAARGKLDFKDSMGRNVKVSAIYRGPSDTDYYKDEEVECVAFPLVGNDMIAYFILPNKTLGLDAFLGNFSAKRFEKIRYGLRTQNILTFMPKFELKSELDLKALLFRKVPSMFTNDAEFDGISDQELTVNRFKQLAVLQVDENGVEAAAATVVESQNKILSKVFRADRPYLVLLADGTGTIDFAATVHGDTF